MRVGIDLVEIERFRSIVENNPAFLERVLTDSERNNTDTVRWAGKFAAKEALIKCGFIKTGEWLNVQILSESNGKPFVCDRFGNVETSVQLSISHTKDYVVAVALYE